MFLNTFWIVRTRMYFYLFLEVSFTRLIIGVSENVLIMHHSKQI